MKKFLGRGLTIVLVLAGGWVLGTLGAGGLQPFGAEENKVERSSSEVIHSITREEQVVLLTLGIQGIEKAETPGGGIWKFKLPGSERVTFLQYSFDAKLGIDGKAVEIQELSEGSYELTIPEFIFIGHKMKPFEAAIEKNGVLSWMTPEIDTTEMVNEILGESRRDAYIVEHIDTLKDQAEAFYSGIIKGLEPTAKVTFVFKSDG